MSEAEGNINRLIGSRLRRARTLRGLSQKRLGDAVAVSSQQIQKYETGVNNITPGKLVAFTEILGVTIQYFFDPPDMAAHRPPPPRQKFLFLSRALERIEQEHPATFLAMCDLAATLTKAN